jgi:hypothetical protein
MNTLKPTPPQPLDLRSRAASAPSVPNLRALCVILSPRSLFHASFHPQAPEKSALIGFFDKQNQFFRRLSLGRLPAASRQNSQFPLHPFDLKSKSPSAVSVPSLRALSVPLPPAHQPSPKPRLCAYVRICGLNSEKFSSSASSALFPAPVTEPAPGRFKGSRGRGGVQCRCYRSGGRGGGSGGFGGRRGGR